MKINEWKTRIANYIVLLTCFAVAKVLCNALKEDVGYTMSKELKLLNKICRKIEREQNEKKLIADSNWEEAVLAATMAVYSVGHLNLIASEQEFELFGDNNEKMNNKIRQHSKFKQIMIQFGSETYNTLNEGQKNTERIIELLEQLQRQTKEAMKLIVLANAKLLRRMLPIPLKMMESAAIESLSMAVKSEKGILRIITFLEQISEVVVSYDKGSMNIKKKKEMLMLDNLQEQFSHLETVKETLVNEIAKAIKNYKTEFDEDVKVVPIGWEAVAQNFFPKLDPSKIVVEVTKLFTETRKLSQIQNIQTANTEVVNLSKLTKQIVEKQLSIAQCATIAAEVNKLLDTIKLSKKKFESSAMSSNDITVNLSAYFGVLKTMVNGYARQRQFASTSKQNTRAEQVFSEAIDASDSATSAINHIDQHGFNFYDKVLNDFNKVLVSARNIVAMETVETGHIERPSNQFSLLGGNIRGMSSENEIFIAAIQKEALVQTRILLNKRLEEIEQFNEQATGFVSNISTTDFATIGKIEIRKIVEYASEQLFSVKNFWTKLVRLHQSLVISIQLSIKYGVTDFESNSEKTNKRSNLSNYSEEKQHYFSIMKEMLFSDIVKILTLSKSIRAVTTSYHGVFKKYLMHELNDQLNFFVMDDQQRSIARLKLRQNNSEIRTEIFSMIYNEKMMHMELIITQIGELENALKAIGQVSEEESEVLKSQFSAFN